MSTLVTIATYHSQPKAEAARILLAQEGIEAVLINETIVAMDWLLMNAIGGIKLQVASHDADRAAGFINTLEAEQKERIQSQATEFIRFKCTECGKPQQFTGDRRGGVETCTKCGRYIDVPELSDEQMIVQHLTLDAATNTTGTGTMAVVQRRVSLPVEIGCVLTFVYVPLLLMAMPFSSHQREISLELGHHLELFSNMLRVVPPLLFIIAVSNEPWSKFGIVQPRWIADPLFAVVIWLVATFALALTLNLLLPLQAGTEVGDEGDALHPAISHVAAGTAGSIGWGAVLLCLVGLTANSLLEELAMRGYLIPRFEELFKSPAIAVGLSSAIFASYHMYQGVEHVVAIFMLALVYGISFCILRRLWPLVIAHTITNMFIYLNI